MGHLWLLSTPWICIQNRQCGLNPFLAWSLTVMFILSWLFSKWKDARIVELGGTSVKTIWFHLLILQMGKLRSKGWCPLKGTQWVVHKSGTRPDYVVSRGCLVRWAPTFSCWILFIEARWKAIWGWSYMHSRVREMGLITRSAYAEATEQILGWHSLLVAQTTCYLLKTNLNAFLRNNTIHFCFPQSSSKPEKK